MFKPFMVVGTPGRLAELSRDGSLQTHKCAAYLSACVALPLLAVRSCLQAAPCRPASAASAPLCNTRGPRCRCVNRAYTCGAIGHLRRTQSLLLDLCRRTGVLILDEVDQLLAPQVGAPVWHLRLHPDLLAGCACFRNSLRLRTS